MIVDQESEEVFMTPIHQWAKSYGARLLVRVLAFVVREIISIGPPSAEEYKVQLVILKILILSLMLYDAKPLRRGR